MELKQINSSISISEQIQLDSMAYIKAQGFSTIICNRPDGEADDQPASSALAAAAEQAGLKFVYLPVAPGTREPATTEAFANSLRSDAPVLAFCRTGNRSSTLWALANVDALPATQIIETVQSVGFNFGDAPTEASSAESEEKSQPAAQRSDNAKQYDVVIVGGGAGGIATAASLLKRDSALNIAIVEPCEEHYYQPGFTMVGGGIFRGDQVVRKNASLMPAKVSWIKGSVTGFDPENNSVTLADGKTLTYKSLVVSPGLKLDWKAVEGLEETMGKNGVTSNYLFDRAPYTWELVQKLKSGRAVFTQPPMPIKCAGAPQKAMYLSCSHWEKQACLKDIDVSFCNAGGVLFGVAHYVPALENYIERYGINKCFNENLVAVDGEAGKAWFSVADEDTNREVEFDMLHVCPPQTAPDFIRDSALSNDAGWVDVEQHSLQHSKYQNIFSLGDVSSTPNAKTAAAVRKQAPVVAENLLAQRADKPLVHTYDGYGSCPLTVEHGKIVLAEFGYGGSLLPSVPVWMLNGAKPTWRSWFLKKSMLPPIYFDLMLKGHEWLAGPKSS